MARVRRLAAAALVAGAVLLPTSSSLAQTPVCTSSGGEYPVVTCDAGGLSATVINVDGDNVTVRISYPDGTFAPFEVVVIIVRSEPQQVGTLTANARGGLDGTITLPDNLEVGSHTISGVGQTTGVTAVLAFRVVANGGAGDPDGGSAGSVGGSAGSSGGGLVNTGSESTIPLAASGITLVMLGAGMVLIARRNKTASAVAV